MYDINNMPQSVEIGHTGDSGITTIRIDMSAWAEDFDGYASIVHVRPGETMEDAYVTDATYDRDDTKVLSWTISSSDLGDTEGTGLAQVWFEETQNQSVTKSGRSIVFATIVRQSINGGDVIPPPQIPWLEQMTKLRTETLAASDAVKEYDSSAEASAEAAATSATNAGTSETNAATSESNAATYAGQAEGYKNAASESASAAEGSASDASGYAEAAAGSADDAAGSATDAYGSASDAEGYKNAAAGYANDASDAAALAKGWAGSSGEAPSETDNAKYYSTQAAASATTAGDKALVSEGYALGKQNGVDVDSTSPYYHNNAKYYSDNAESIIESATETAIAEATADAEESAEDSEAYAVGTRDGVDVENSDPAYHNNSKYYAEAAQDAAASASAAYNTSLLAPTYSATAAYNVGDHVIYSGNYYVCNTAIPSGGETWTAAHWTQVTVGGEESALKGAYNELTPYFARDTDGKYGYISEAGLRCRIQSTGAYGTNATALIIPVSSGDLVSIKANNSKNTSYAILRSFSYPVTSGASADYSEQTGFTSNRSVSAGANGSFTVPSDGKFLYVLRVYSNTDYTPVSLKINHSEMLTGVRAKLQETNDNILPLVGYKNAEQIAGRINSTTWAMSSAPYHILIPVASGDKVTIKANSTKYTSYAILKSYNFYPANGDSVDFSTATGFTELLTVNSTNTGSFTVPSDGIYLYLLKTYDSENYFPVSVAINGVEILNGIVKNVEGIDKTLEDYGTLEVITADCGRRAHVTTKGYVEYPITANKLYRVQNDSEVSIRFITKDGTTTVQNIVVNYGETKIIQPEQSTGRIYIYTVDHDPTYIVDVTISEVGTFSNDIALNTKNVKDVGYLLPDYYVTHLAGKVPIVLNNMASVGRNGETFLFITDEHWTQNDRMSIALIRNMMMQSQIHTIVNGGDIITMGNRDEMRTAMLDFLTGIQVPGKIVLHAFGNHDSNWKPTKDENYFEFDEQYAYIGKGMESYVHWMTDNDFSFYYDNPDCKTRYLVLDSGEGRGENENGREFTAFEELYNVLLDVDTGWKVLVVVHMSKRFYIRSVALPAFDAYNAGQSVRLGGVTFDFTNGKSKGKIVLCVSGHEHKDEYYTTAGGIPVIVTTCDAKYPSDYAFHSVNSQAFDVVTANYTDSIINCTRIGRGKNRKINATVNTLTVGGTKQLTTSITSPVWSAYKYVASDGSPIKDESNVSVSNGLVTANSAGNAIVVATGENDMEIWCFIVS